MEQKKEKAPVRRDAQQADVYGQRITRIEESLERQVKLMTELLTLLRGSGLDTGLLGKTQELDARLSQVQGFFRWAMVVLTGLIVAVVGQYFK